MPNSSNISWDFTQSNFNLIFLGENLKDDKAIELWPYQWPNKDIGSYFLLMKHSFEYVIFADVKGSYFFMIYKQEAEIIEKDNTVLVEKSEEFDVNAYIGKLNADGPDAVNFFRFKSGITNVLSFENSRVKIKLVK